MKQFYMKLSALWGYPYNCDVTKLGSLLIVFLLLLSGLNTKAHAQAFQVDASKSYVQANAAVYYYWGHTNSETVPITSLEMPTITVSTGQSASGGSVYSNSSGSFSATKVGSRYDINLSGNQSAQYIYWGGFGNIVSRVEFLANAKFDIELVYAAHPGGGATNVLDVIIYEKLGDGTYQEIKRYRKTSPAVFALDPVKESFLPGKTYALQAVVERSYPGGTSVVYGSQTGNILLRMTPEMKISGISDDTGVLANDAVTRDETINIFGSTTPGAIVTLKRNGSAIGMTTADGTGNWTFDYTATILAEGVHTFSASATDGLANDLGTSNDFAVRIDKTAPTITALNAVTVSTDAGKNTASGVLLGSPITADNHQADPATNNAPSIFPLGNTTVTWTATDIAGNIATASQVVTVNDTEAPVPTLANLPKATGECSVTVTAPTATDNTAGTITGTTTSPLTYNKQGNYTITWTYNDGKGNTTTQIQEVEVKDITLPIFAAVAPINKNSDPDKCGAVVTYTTPTATDNCVPAPDPNDVNILNRNGQLYDHVNKLSVPQNSPGLPLTFTPTDGNKLAVFLVNSSTTALLYQDITLPVTGPINLTYDLQYKNHYVSGFNSNQFVAVEIRNPSTNAVLKTLFKTEPGAPLATSMVSYNHDLSEFAGQEIRLVMTNTRIQSYYFDIILDNVKITNAPLVNGSFETGDYTGWTITESGSGTWGIGTGLAKPVTITQTAGLASGAEFPVGTTTNTFKATDAAGNIAEISFDVTVTDTQKPTVITKNITVQLDANGEATITAAMVNDGSTDNCSIPADGYSLDKTSFDVSNLGANTVTLTVTDVNGNSNTFDATVTVIDNTNPVFTSTQDNVIVALDAVTGTASLINYAALATATDNSGTVTITQSPVAGTALVKDVATTVTLTATDIAGNNVKQTFTVTAKDQTAPVPTVADLATITGECSATVTAPTATDNVAGTITGTTTDPLTYTSQGEFTITWTYNDGNGNTSSQTQKVIVKDVTAPNVLTQNITVQLDATGAATITAAQVDNGSSDNCGIDTIVLDKMNFTCSHIGANKVKLTVKDVNGLTSTVEATVTVEDNVDPIVITQNITVELDENGTATITAAQINNGSTDNCSIPANGYSLDKYTFSCADAGTNTVTLTVTDANGNSDSKTAIVTVVDNLAPVAKAKNITVQLDENGTATIVAADVNDGSSDNCGIVSYTLDKYTFGCSDTGDNTVTLKVKDANGNEASTTATVTVEDKVKPNAIAQDITVQLGANGTATITAADINNNSTDNCEIASVSIDVTSFDCSNIGANTVTLTVTDKSGNNNTATAKVTVEDKVVPVVLTQNITVELDATGNATITAAQVDNGSSDNCAIESMVLNKASFDCSNVGDNMVTLIVTDKRGNVSTGTATVTVVDKVAPVALAKNITIQLNASGNATIVAADVDNGSADACGAVTLSLSKTNFDCSNIGPNAVTLTVTDVNNNSSTVTATVTVEDKVAPTAIAQDLRVELDANGNATITAAQVDNGSSDNCGIETITLSKTSFDCSNVGANTVTLTVTDKNGNVSTATAIITVEDKLTPVVVTQNVTIQLDANGKATLTAAQVNNGSKDNCGIASLTISKTDFDCSNVGANTVTLIITDNNGNTASATATVTVEDNVAPTITAPAAVVVDVDAGKNTASNVMLGTPATADNCSVASVTSDAPAVYPTGTTTVTWTVTDASGNTSTATQTVIVRRDVVGVAQLAKINVPIRTTYANVPLPANVMVTYSNGETATVGITWAQGTYNGLVAGNYTLSGQLVLEANTTNTTAKAAAVTVVVEPNKVPTALAFSATTFKPEAKADDVIGTLTTTDPDDNQFIYTLVSGNGDTNNNLFEIRGDKVYLKSNKGLSGQLQFTFRVRSTDPYQNTIEKTFTLSKGKYEVAEDKLKIVNAFSPNNDGINDTWFIPELRFYNSVEVEVFDRSGVRIFHTTDPEKGWDGRSLNGQVLKGAFFYIVQVKDINLVKKGVVTIISK